MSCAQLPTVHPALPCRDRQGVRHPGFDRRWEAGPAPPGPILPVAAVPPEIRPNTPKRGAHAGDCENASSTLWARPHSPTQKRLALSTDSAVSAPIGPILQVPPVPLGPANRTAGFLHMVANISQARIRGVCKIGGESFLRRAHRSYLTDDPANNIAQRPQLSNVGTIRRSAQDQSPP